VADDKRLIIPRLGVCRIESYPLGDYLYDRSKAADDLRKYLLAWIYYLHNQPEDVQEAVSKVARLFGKKPDEIGAV
jgi:hypothetical protein